MSERKRAAVVLFVDSESGVDGPDIANLVLIALHQAGTMKDGLTVRQADGKEHHVRIIHAIEAGMAAGNGYLWTEPTAKAWHFFKEDDA